MARTSDYNSYFEYQATQHPELQHQPESGQQVFAIIPFTSAYGQYRTAIREKSFMMRLINYTFGMTDGDDQSRKSMVGGFIISKWHGTAQDITTEVTAAMEDSEKVVEDIVAKMVRDSQEGHPLFDSGADEVGDLQLNAQPLFFTGDGTYSGWIVTFKLNNYFDHCDSTRSGVVWPDGGTTPYS